MLQPYRSGQVPCAPSGAGSSMQADSITPDWLDLLQSNISQLLKAQLDFLLTVLLLLFLLLLLLPSLVKAGSLVNKCGCKLLLHNCFHILGLSGSRAQLSSQLCLTVGKKPCRLEERSCPVRPMNTQMLADIRVLSFCVGARQRAWLWPGKYT